MKWQGEDKSKLASAEEAVRIVESGDRGAGRKPHRDCSSRLPLRATKGGPGLALLTSSAPSPSQQQARSHQAHQHPGQVQRYLTCRWETAASDRRRCAV